MKTRVIYILLAITLTFSVGLLGCGGAVVPQITEYNLTISSTQGGSITTPGEGTRTYEAGKVVNLAAEPDEGYHFVNWTGDVGTVANVENATTTITMNGNYEITANFASGPAIPLKNPGSFSQMTIADIDSLDPAWGYDTASAEQVQYIYETLIFYDREKVDEFVPVLATEWNASADGKTIRFKIRQGVKFHEGGELTPEDVEYSFERAMVQDRSVEEYAPAGPIWLLYQPLLGLGGSRDGDGHIIAAFDQIDNAVEVDGDWVVFHLYDRAWGLAFLQILCSPWASIVDKEWCIAHGEWDGTEETWQDYNNPDRGDSYLYNHTNGTGPWKLEAWDPGVQIKLVRNDDYWRGPAAFGTVTTKFVGEWTTRKEALLTGDADFVSVWLPWTSQNWGWLEHIEELEGIADLNVYQDLPDLATETFFFNFNIASASEFIGSGALDGNGIPTDFFTDADVRKGFNYAFDWKTYIDDGWLGNAQQAGSPVVEGLPFYNPDASMYSLDLKKAEQHLKAAWAGQVWEKGFKFTLLYPPGRLPRETTCKILAANLYAINPKFQVAIQPMAGAYFHRTPMWQGAWLVDYPHPNDFVRPFMTAGYGFAGQQGYGYPELDQLVEAAFKEPDPAVQKDMYFELQERYYQDAPGIMLCQPLGSRFFTKYIDGFYFNPMICGNAGPLYYMSKSSS